MMAVSTHCYKWNKDQIFAESVGRQNQPRPLLAAR
jgi:hypothetical protein